MSENEELQPTEELPAQEESQVEGVEKPAESAPAEEGKKVQFDEAQQRVVDGIVGEKVGKLRAAEREKAALQKELEALRARDQPKPVEVPPLPDLNKVSDAEYNQVMAARDQALRHNAALDAENKAAQKRAAEAQQELQRRQHEELIKTVSDYNGRAQKLGISTQELQSAAQVINSIGMSDDIAQLILEDDDGPLITKYLSMNIAELDTLSQMSPVRAAARLASVIKPKAAAMKPKTSKAPDPIDIPAGGSVTGSGKSAGGSKFITFY
jgi:hypothetical protein